MDTNPHLTDTEPVLNTHRSEQSEINDNLKAILLELRNQKSEIVSLKQEVQDNSVNVAQIKKLKTEKDVQKRVKKFIDKNKIKFT